MSRRRFIRQSVLVGGSSVAGVAGIGSVGRADEGGAAAARRGPVLDVRDFGAVGDGRRDDTRAIQSAVDTGGELGGGIVRLPAGTWMSGTVRLRSRVTVDLAPGAILRASARDEDFAPYDVLPFRTGSDRETTDFAHALLAGHGLERVAITGVGVIDMNRSRRGGPKPIALKSCRFVTVRDITIVHAPNYCVSLGGCDDVLIDGVTIRHAYADGIDPDCCHRVRVANCDIESDDDALCLKASFALGTRGETADVVVTNCRLRSPSNCFKLGTESTGDFRHIVVSNCVFSGQAPVDHDASPAAEGGGLALTMVDGGTVDGVLISNVIMYGVPAPLFIRLGNRGRDQDEPRPGRLRNVSINGVVATGATGTGSITGLAGYPVEGIVLENVRIRAVGGEGRGRDLEVPERDGAYPRVTMFGGLPASGLYVRHARDVILRNVQLAVESDDGRAALVVDDVAGLHVSSLSGGAGNETGPVVWLHGVRGGLLQGNHAPEGVGVFVRVTGEDTRNVALVGNAYCTPGPVEIAPEIAPRAVVQMASTGPDAGVALRSG